MAQSECEAWECAICSEVLSDPRALPCGHSFCGPPRKCLTNLKHEFSGKLRCALCTIEHDVKVKNLTPLYGIREGLDSLRLEREKPSSSKIQSSQKASHCDKHCGYELSLWCTNCGEAICSRCVNESHEDHDMKSLKAFLRKEFVIIQDRLEALQLAAITSDENISRLNEEQMKHEKLADEFRLKIEKAVELKELTTQIDNFGTTPGSFCKDGGPNFDISTFLQLRSCLSSLDNNELQSLKHSALREPFVFRASFFTIRKLQLGKEFNSASIVTGEHRFWVSCLHCDFGDGEVLMLFLHCEPIDFMKLNGRWQTEVNYKLILLDWLEPKRSINLFNTKKFSYRETCYGESIIQWESLLDPCANWLSGNDRILIECQLNQISEE